MVKRVLAIAALSGCNAILGNTPGHPYDDAGADAGADGACAACPPAEIAGARDCPVDLAVANGRVYWVDQGSTQNSATDGVVASAAIDCATDCVTVHASNERSPSALAVNADTIWWTSLAIPTSESTIRALAFGGAPRTFAMHQYFPRSMTIDDQSVFWINSCDAPPSATGEVRRQYFDGATSTAIVFTLDSPVEIALRAGRIYWTNDGDSDTTGYVMSADVTGSPAVKIAENQSHPRGVAVGATYVYWANSGDGTIMRARHDGTEPTRLFAERATPSNLAVDDVAIYWTEAGTPPAFADGKVMAARLDGSGVVTIAAQQKNPRRIVLDAANVFWIARGTPGCTQHDGRVMRAAKTF